MLLPAHTGAGRLKISMTSPHSGLHIALKPQVR